MLAFQENDPNAYFRREINRTISGNPLLHPLELSDLEKVNMDEALAFIRRCFNPADYTFVFTGNLDIPLLRSLAETYLASINGSGPVTGSAAVAFNEWAQIDPKRPPDTKKELRKGREERSAVYISWYPKSASRPEPYSEEKSAAISALNGYLEIKLNDVIREELGSVYSISSWVSLSPIPSVELSGGALFICDPRRAEELIQAVKNEFSQIAGGNIDPGILLKAKEALVKQHEEAIQQNLYIAQSYANSAVIYNSPLSRLDKRPGLYRAQTSADIRKAAVELMEGSQVIVVLYPEGN
jgi:zinc protease